MWHVDGIAEVIQVNFRPHLCRQTVSADQQSVKVGTWAGPQ